VRSRWKVSPCGNRGTARATNPSAADDRVRDAGVATAATACGYADAAIQCAVTAAG